MNKNPIDYVTPNYLAAIWSMMLPGLGQMMLGRVMPGLLWASLASSGYFSYFWPGLIVHGLCILDAAFYKGQGSLMNLRTWGVVASMICYIIFRNGY